MQTTTYHCDRCKKEIVERDAVFQIVSGEYGFDAHSDTTSGTENSSLPVTKEPFTLIVSGREPEESFYRNLNRRLGGDYIVDGPETRSGENIKTE